MVGTIFHLSCYLSDAVVTNSGQKPLGEEVFLPNTYGILSPDVVTLFHFFSSVENFMVSCLQSFPRFQVSEVERKERVALPSPDKKKRKHNLWVISGGILGVGSEDIWGYFGKVFGG